jgi:ATP-dependent DNA helicase RecG
LKLINYILAPICFLKINFYLAGSLLMVRKCVEKGLPPPIWKSDSKLGVTVTFFPMEATTEVTTEVTTEATTEVKRLLHHLKGEMSRSELQLTMGLKNAEHFRKSYINPALALGVIERVEPEKSKISATGEF